jgi:3-oxoadipate enol-lactonase
MLSETTRSRDPSVAADIGAAFANFDPRSAAHTARSVLTRSNGLRDVLPRIRVPTVVIAGDEDKLYPPAGLEALARLIPGARFVLAVGSGHLTALEAPEYIVDAINLLGARPEVLAQ